MGYLCQVGLGVFLFLFSQNIWAVQSVGKQVKILGKKISVSQHLSASKGEVGTATHISLFGKKIDLVRNSVQYKVNESEGPSYDNQFYIKGKKVLGHSFINGVGSFATEVDVPYVEVAGDVFSYSLGILSVGVYSGVSYEGQLNSQISSELFKETPLLAPDMNLVNASASVDVMAKGFIEGQVKVLFIKGAVGGSIDLIDGEAAAAVSVNADTVETPLTSYHGIVHLLSGELYGSIGSGRSKWAGHTFYKSKGYCHAFGESVCGE